MIICDYVSGAKIKRYGNTIKKIKIAHRSVSKFHKNDGWLNRCLDLYLKRFKKKGKQF